MIGCNRISISLVLIGILFALLTQRSCQTVDSISLTSMLRSNKVTSIMEWNNYMKLYHKSYSSISQELARQKVFLARVIEVFLSSFKYKLYQQSYYTAINKYSDLTPAESNRMLNGDSSTDSDNTDQPMDDSKARELLLEAIASNELFAGNRDSIEADLRRERVAALRQVKRRRKRSSGLADNNRDLNINDLIKVPRDQSVEVSELNIQRIVPPENPDYEPPSKITSTIVPNQPLETANSPQQLTDIPADRIGEIEKSITGESNERPVNEGLVKSAISGVVGWFSNDLEPKAEEEDSVVVIRDWRQTGCISPPIDQGYCASCYAVSSMAYVEWSYCMSQGNVITPLSPQYMVSCGLQFKEETYGKMVFNGCNQGSTRQTMYFVKEYGVELEANMPYVADETHCPVEPFTPLKKKGYIRPNIKPPIRLSGKTTQLDLALKNGPVIVSMRNPVSFIVLGGGMVEKCQQDGGHAMLVVGNMIEDGTEYLLIKNSFGLDWGTDGYFKLKRSAVPECVKEFVVPIVSFPSKKSQARRVKAYLMRDQQQSEAAYCPTQRMDSEKFQVDQLFDESA